MVYLSFKGSNEIRAMKVSRQTWYARVATNSVYRRATTCMLVVEICVRSWGEEGWEGRNKDRSLTPKASTSHELECSLHSSLLTTTPACHRCRPRQDMALLFRRPLLGFKTNASCGSWSFTPFVLPYRLHTQSRLTSSSSNAEAAAEAAATPTSPPTSSSTSKPVRRGAPYTPEEDKLIQLRRQQGVSFTKIAAELGVESYNSVLGRYYTVQKHASAKSREDSSGARSKFVSWDTKAEETLIRRYNQGAPLDDIAREMNRTRMSVHNKLYRLYALPESAIQPRAPPYRPLTHDESVQIAAWRSEKMTWSDIGIRLNRNPSTLSSVFSDAKYREAHAMENEFNTWSPAEDAELLTLLRAGLDRKEICLRLKRSTLALRVHISRLKSKAPKSAGSGKRYMADST